MDDLLEPIDFTVRAETPSDLKAVFEVNCLAFGSDEESKLVDRLRVAATPSISLVAESGGVVSGHIFFSPVGVEQAPGDATCMGLGPMAVLPKLQNRGVGSRLVEEGLSRCRDAGVAAVFVLGHPDYYPRFGFRGAPSLGFRYRDRRYDPYFFVAELKEGFVGSAAGLVTYHPAFDSL